MVERLPQVAANTEPTPKRLILGSGTVAACSQWIGASPEGDFRIYVNVRLEEHSCH
jgi:hypothetical protein